MKPQLSYVRSGDYWIPDLELEITEQHHLNKYGRMRRTFLRVIPLGGICQQHRFATPLLFAVNDHCPFSTVLSGLAV